MKVEDLKEQTKTNLMVIVLESHKMTNVISVDQEVIGPETVEKREGNTLILSTQTYFYCLVEEADPVPDLVLEVEEVDPDQEIEEAEETVDLDLQGNKW